MVSLVFLLKLMGIIEEKSPNCISIVLGFRQCLRGCLYENFGNFGCTVGAHFGGAPLNWWSG